MSNILIKGMDMSKDKPICIIIDPAGQARRYDLNNDKYANDELFEAVPVPPHGRLIDVDALSEHKFVCIPHVSVDGKEAGSAYRLGWNTAIEAIMENAETIIGGE